MSLYDCHNCKHDDKNALQVPCKACRGKGDEKPTMWEPCDSFIAADVLPCPLCGGEPGLYLSIYAGVRRVACKKCGCNTGDYKTLEEAKAAWNKRV